MLLKNDGILPVMTVYLFLMFQHLLSLNFGFDVLDQLPLMVLNSDTDLLLVNQVNLFPFLISVFILPFGCLANRLPDLLGVL